MIADNLSKAGFSWGCVSAVDLEGQTVWIVDAHRDDGNRFVVRADEIADSISGSGMDDSPVCGEFIVVKLSPLFEIAVMFVGLEVAFTLE
jgi:hypothetical protein